MVAAAIALAVSAAAGRFLSGWLRNGLIGGVGGYAGITFLDEAILEHFDGLPGVIVGLVFFWLVFSVFFWVADIAERGVR